MSPDASRAMRRAWDALVGAAPELASWRERWLEQGPTPFSGPLAHDLVHGPDPQRVGLNLFDHGEPLLPLARAWCAEHLPAAARPLAELEARLPPSTAVHAGVARDPSRGWRLKLWLPALPELAAHLGVPAGPWTHLGVDLRDGLERARGYRRIDAPEPSWPSSAEWLATSAPHSSHRLLAELGAWPAAESKRSFDTIFSPEATLDDLFAEEARAVALGVPRYLDRDRLGALDNELRAEGLCLRPAAYEIDRHPSREPEPDALLTVSRRGRSS